MIIPAAGSATAASSCGCGAGAGGQLSNQQQREVAALKQRDRQVRAHEAAHLAASGGYARGGPSFTYQKGPDGRLYAVGGEVGIDVSAIPGDPAATLRKAETVERAALAPAQPSGQDRSVAARAAALAAQARQQLARQTATEGSPGSSANLSQRIRAGGATAQDSASLHLVA
jgi:hypothetical protein